MEEEDELAILDDSGIAKGSLPIRYLGVPLITKRLTSADCVPLVNAITGRIKHWTSRQLSYAGRLQLIRSVLFAIQTYWSSIFPLPAEVCNRIEQLMSRFLWSGPALDPHRAKVAWDEVCKPRTEGGLGIKRVAEWNEAATLKHIWYLFSDPDDAVWARWVRTNLLSGKSFWSVKAPDKCSWVWKRLLSLRHLVRNLISWRMGDGSRISFWYDCWSPAGPIINQFGDEEVRRSRIPIEATVNNVFMGRPWRQFLRGPTRRIHRHQRAFFERINALIPPQARPIPGRRDCVVWKLRPDGIFTIASAWNHIRPQSPKVNWTKLVWAKGMLPRFSFLLWLVIRQRLRTADFWFRLGIGTSPTCAICGCFRETIDHIFFLCSFSREVWTYTLALIVPVTFPVTWSGIYALVFGYAGHPFSRSPRFGRLLSAVMYYIWMERNKRRIGERHLLPRALAALVWSTVPDL